jgi:hypothetical protein
VPRDLAEDASPLVFDPNKMQKLFDVGFKHAASTSGWHSAPLSLAPEEQVPPRGSVQFKVDEPRSGRSSQR